MELADYLGYGARKNPTDFMATYHSDPQITAS